MSSDPAAGMYSAYTIDASAGTYAPGTVAVTPGTIPIATATITLSGTAHTVVTATGSGTNTAQWDPTLSVAVPSGAEPGTYTGTISTSVTG
jgi:hypothetical protein